MRKIDNSMIAGLLGGLIGVICMDISNFILWRNKTTEGLYGHLAGSMIMKPSKLNKTSNFLLGQVFHMTVGSCLGVGMSQILKQFGKDNYIIKGGFFSVVVWGFLYNFGQKMNFFRMNPRLTKSGYASIWHHLIYGLATSKAIVTLTAPNVFPKKESINTQDKNAFQNRFPNEHASLTHYQPSPVK
ncbi:hypothetical protein [Desulfosporosinus sp. FKA]|uniref:hypothetical protein n=1 Tax=Desulfosporosinus sp. FKA TaxID=1969834 RepID=UPI001FA83814|nr:hypothetical protein [Desulfosporosinus sp. FKA]